MRLISAVLFSVVLFVNSPAIDKVVLTIPGNGGVGPYRLDHSPILVNTESVTVGDSVLVTGQDYRIDYNSGYIILEESLPQTDTMIVAFQISPIQIQRSFVQNRPVAYTHKDTTIVQPEKKQRTFSSDLDIVGSKGFAVNIGDIGEPSLTQSLDLNISGQLARDVYIRGSVSDQNLGSSSGGTRSLDELDKILISIESKNFNGDFGDLELEGVNGSLLDFERKLTGLDVKANVGKFNGSSALAFSPGEQVEIFFYGVDGKQGPYVLDVSDVSSSSTSEVFLPGTEEVYLDGVLLTRGVENDYTIDYYERYIQFMSRNIITSNSRITVKIQLSPEGYRRSFYHINSFYDSGIQFGVQYIGEHDDKSNPRNFDLGETEREAIASAGEVQDSAYVSGAKYVGDGEGSYVAVTDSLGSTYYEYVGANEGDYSVSFSRIGAGSGSYEYAGTGQYIYVGEGNGAYSPIIYYPLPEIQDFGSFILNKPGDLYINSELAFSRYDPNSLSSVDEIQTGLGFLGNLSWGNKKIDLLGKKVNAELFDLQARLLDSEFNTPGIIDRPEFLTDYNIPQEITSSSERLFELESRYNTQANENLNFGGGYLENDQYQARRGFMALSVLASSNFMVSGSVELSQSTDKYTDIDSDWNRYEAGVGTAKGWIKPAVVYRHELYDGLLTTSSGYKANEYESSVAMTPVVAITSTSTVTYRHQQYFEDESIWSKQYDRYSIEQELKYGSSGGKFTGEMNYSRIYQKQVYPTIEDLTRNMGSLKLNYNATDIGVTFYENINGTGQVTRVREYVYVGEGKGDYRKDGEDYVAETGGDYIEVIRQLDETDEISGYEISGGLRLRLNTRALTSDNIFGRIVIDSDFSHTTNLEGDTQLALKHIFPLSNYDEDEMSYKTYSYQQRSTLRLNKAGDYIRHTLKTTRSDGSYYEYENQSDRTNSNSAEVKLFSRTVVSVLSSAEYATEKEWLYSGNVDIERIEIEVVPEFKPLRMLKIEVPLAYSNEDEKVDDLLVESYTFGLKSVANIKEIGRFEFDGTYTRVEVDSETASIPYVVAGGKKPGDNFNAIVSARFKLNSYSRVEFSYTYKELGDGYNNSTLRIEAKAEF